VIIDPDHVLPDVNPDNNAFSGVTVAQGVTASTVIKNYLAAIGSEDRVKGINDLVVTSEGSVQGATVVRVNKYKTPDKILQDVTVPSYNNLVVAHVVIEGDSVHIKQLNRVVPLTASEKISVKARYRLFPELNFNKDGYSMQLDPQLKVVNGQLAYLVTVAGPDGIKIKYYYDQKTGLKVRQFTDVPNSTVMDFGDYRDINTGIKIPFSEKTTIVGQPIEFKVKGAMANGGLTNDIFK